MGLPWPGIFSPALKLLNCEKYVVNTNITCKTSNDDEKTFNRMKLSVVHFIHMYFYLEERSGTIGQMSNQQPAMEEVGSEMTSRRVN